MPPLSSAWHSVPPRTSLRSRRRRQPKLKVLGGLAFCLAVACSSASPNVTGTGIATPTSSGSASQGVDKILVIVEENHSIGQVFPSRMPYLWSLATKFGRATEWRHVGHPSLPNYLAMFGGSSFNDPQDCFPSSGCTFPGPSVFGQA